MGLRDNTSIKQRNETLEALHNRKLRPGINTLDEFTSNELTLRLQSKTILSEIIEHFNQKNCKIGKLM